MLACVFAKELILNGEENSAGRLRGGNERKQWRWWEMGVCVGKGRGVYPRREKNCQQWNNERHRIKSRGIVWKKGWWKSEVEILLAWEFAYVSVTEAAWRHINHIWNTSTIIHCLGVILIILSRTANDSPVSPRGWNQRRHRERGKEEDKVMRERRGEGKKEKKRHARGRRRGRISQRKQCVS